MVTLAERISESKLRRPRRPPSPLRVSAVQDTIAVKSLHRDNLTRSYPQGSTAIPACETKYPGAVAQPAPLASAGFRAVESDSVVGSDPNPPNINAPARQDFYSSGVIQPNSRLYFTQDANWDTTAVVGYDSTTGTWQVVQRYVYSPYGNITILNPDFTTAPTGTVPMANNLHQGMALDPVTGLYYERARWYSPSLGTWTSQDPLQYINGADTYQFVMSNPVGRVDPFGLAGVTFDAPVPPPGGPPKCEPPVVYIAWDKWEADYQRARAAWTAFAVDQAIATFDSSIYNTLVARLASAQTIAEGIEVELVAMKVVELAEPEVAPAVIGLEIQHLEAEALVNAVERQVQSMGPINNTAFTAAQNAKWGYEHWLAKTYSDSLYYDEVLVP